MDKREMIKEINQLKKEFFDQLTAGSEMENPVGAFATGFSGLIESFMSLQMKFRSLQWIERELDFWERVKDSRWQIGRVKKGSS